MTGIIDVGGGNRCVYSAGVYDCFLDNDYMPDYALGVSAGSANLISFIARQRGRTFRFYTDYAQRSEYMSKKNIIRYGSPLGLDYIFGTLSAEDGEDPLDYDAFAESPVRFLAAATRARDGKGVFFGRESISKNNYEILKASCSLPVICRQRRIGWDKYVDGGVAEPIPFKKAFADGCEKVIVVLTKPDLYYKIPDQMIYGGAKYMKWMPEVGRLCRNLHERCASLLIELKELEEQGKAFILQPETTFGVTTLSRDIESMKKLYDLGYSDGSKFLESGWLNEK